VLDGPPEWHTKAAHRMGGAAAVAACTQKRGAGLQTGKTRLRTGIHCGDQRREWVTTTAARVSRSNVADLAAFSAIPLQEAPFCRAESVEPGYELDGWSKAPFGDLDETR